MKFAAALLLSTALLASASAFAAEAPATAPTIEAAILVYKAHLAETCPNATFSRGFAASLDLNGDGRPDAILSSQFMDCPASAMNGWAGSAGSATRFVVSRADGSYATRDGIYHTVEPMLDAGGFQLKLAHHGSVCNRSGAEACGEIVRFDGDAMSTVSWPDGREPRFDPNRKPMPVALRSEPTAPPGMPTSSFDVIGNPFDHNGSVVRVDTGAGTIVYDNPKAAIRTVARHGTVLFRGRIGDPGRVSGTAYAFKEGCDPAPYAVDGHYAGGATIVLRGMGPVRRGCEVVAYSERSPHSKLVFTVIMSD